MSKPIHYEIKKIRNAVLIHVPFPEHWTVFDVLDKHLDYVCEGFGFCVCTRLDFSADEHINKIHAAIHAEFCGWEPKKHEQVRTEGGLVWEYIAKDDNTGNHICLMRCESDLPDTLGCFESVFPMESIPTPTGPCEVAYGIEGLEDGMQVSESDLCGPCEQDLINAGRQSIIEEILDAIEGPACDELAELSEQEFISIIARKFLDFGNMHIAYDFEWVWVYDFEMIGGEG